MPSLPSPLFYDSLTGLPTVLGWINELDNHAFPESGGLIAFNISNVPIVNQTFGHTAGDVLLRQVIVRAHQALPESAVPIRGAGNRFFIWLPAATDTSTATAVDHLREIVCANPVTLPEQKTIYPKLTLVQRLVTHGTAVCEILPLLEQQLARQPEAQPLTLGGDPQAAAQEELERQLQSLRLFGREKIAQQIMLALRLPAIQPRTVLLVAPPEADKAQLLTSISTILGNQQMPVAEVFCRPSDQMVPFSLLSALLERFLAGFPGSQMRQRMHGICLSHPWIAGLFPSLHGDEVQTPLPERSSVIRDGLVAVLLELARSIPHIALIHSIHLADTDSLLALAEVQKIAQQGLRIVAGTDPAPQSTAIPSRLHPLSHEQTTTLSIPPLTQEEVAAYLRAITGEGVEPCIAETALLLSGGWPLAINQLLRSWVVNRSLAYQHNRWFFSVAVASPSPHYSELDKETLLHFAEVAVATPVTAGTLASVWQMPEGEVRGFVDRARTLGYLHPVEGQDPEVLRFTNEEHVLALIGFLSPEQRAAVCQAVAQMHHAESVASVVKAPPTPSPAASAPVVPAWEEPVTILSDPRFLPELTQCATLLRIAGVQAALYPAESKTVREAVQAALTPLLALISRASRLALMVKGTGVFFGGQRLLEREIAIIIKDLHTWMTQQELRAIEFTAGLDAPELTRFLQFWCLPPPTEKLAPLGERLEPCQLTSIHVIPAHAILLAERSGPEAPLAESPTPEHGIPPVEGDVFTIDSHQYPRFFREILGSEYFVQLTTSFVSESAMWARLRKALEEAQLEVRQPFFINLSRWLSDHQAAMPSDTLEMIDLLLIEFMQHEDDPRIIQGIILNMEVRLLDRMKALDGRGALVFFEAMDRYVKKDPNTGGAHHIAEFFDRIGPSTPLFEFIDQSASQPGGLASAHRVVEILGERVLRPLLMSLKKNEVMQERIRAMQLLREFGDINRPLLIHELRESNPWYVARNLLLVLSEIGTEEALGAVSDKIRHEDPRVRAEAVTAAVRIARQNAVPYLMLGLEDENAEVRARSAAVAGLCQQARVEELLRGLLQRKDEPENVQLSACLALGQFLTDSSREALVRVLHPQLLDSFRKKSDEVRSTAIVALAKHFEHPSAQGAIQQALRDRSLIVSQTAHRIWHQQKPH